MARRFPICSVIDLLKRILSDDRVATLQRLWRERSRERRMLTLDRSFR